MIIKGNRRGGAGQLAAHLLRSDSNEAVHVREINGFPANSGMERALENALRLMEAQGRAQGKNRVLYHTIIAPQAEEILTDKQLKYVVDTLADNLGLSGRARVIVEHRKDGRQHFHVVFNVLDQNGKPARLQWTRKKEWNTARQVETELALKPVVSKGRAVRRWEHERGERSGIDPLQVRTEITAIYRTCKTSKEFVDTLAKAGYVLTRGRNGAFVIVDASSHVHGLMRRIEGAKLSDLNRKFPDLAQMNLPPLEVVTKAARPSFQACASAILAPMRETFRLASFSTVSPYGRAFAHKKIRTSGSGSVRAHRRAALEERGVAFRALAQFLAYRPRPQKTRPDPRPLRPYFYDSSSETARIIAWAFRNGRLDVLALYGIFLPADFFG